MLDDREDYHYLTENAIARVTIAGHPYTARDQQLVPIGEDEAWLREAAFERADMAGMSPPTEIVSKTDVALKTLRMEPLADGFRKVVDAVLAAGTWVDPDEVGTLTDSASVLAYETAGEYVNGIDPSTGVNPTTQAYSDVQDEIDDFDNRREERAKARDEAILGVLDEQTGEREGGADNDLKDALVAAADAREAAYSNAEDALEDALEAEAERYASVPDGIRNRHAATIAAKRQAIADLGEFPPAQEYKAAEEELKKAEDDLEKDLMAAEADHLDRIAAAERECAGAKAAADTKYLNDRVDAWKAHDDAVWKANDDYKTADEEDVDDTGEAIIAILYGVHADAGTSYLGWTAAKIAYDRALDEARLKKSLADPWFLKTKDDEGGEDGCKPRPIVYPLASTPVARLFDDFDRMTVCARNIAFHRMTYVETLTTTEGGRSIEEVYVFDEHGSWLGRGGLEYLAYEYQSTSPQDTTTTAAYSSSKLGIRFGNRWQTENEVVDSIVAYVLVNRGDSGDGSDYDSDAYSAAFDAMNDEITDAVKDAAAEYGLSLPSFYTSYGGHYGPYGGWGLMPEERTILQYGGDDNQYWQRYEAAVDAFNQATNWPTHYYRGQRLHICRLVFEREEESDTDYLDAVDAAEDARDAALKAAAKTRDEAYGEAQEVHQAAVDAAYETYCAALAAAEKTRDEAHVEAYAAYTVAATAAGGGWATVNAAVADADVRKSKAWTAEEYNAAVAEAKAAIESWERSLTSAKNQLASALNAANAAYAAASTNAQRAYNDAVSDADRTRRNARYAADDDYNDAVADAQDAYNDAIHGVWDEDEGKYVGGADQITPDKVAAAKAAYNAAKAAADRAESDASDAAYDALNAAIESAVRAGADYWGMTVPSGYEHTTGMGLDSFEQQALRSDGGDNPGWVAYLAAIDAYNAASSAAGAAHSAAVNAAKRAYATAMAAISAATPNARMLFTADISAPSGGWQVKSQSTEYNEHSWAGNVRVVGTVGMFVVWKPQTSTVEDGGGGMTPGG